MSAFGEDVVAAVNAVGAEQIILVGHSMGGPVVVEAANLLGERAIGIVGVDSFYIPFEYPTSDEKIEGFIKPFENDFKSAVEQMVRSMFTPDADPELIDSIVEQMSVVDQDVGVSAAYEVFKWNALNASADLQKYANILRNINAAPTGKENALHASVTLISGVGHYIAQTKPEAFSMVLESMIAAYQKQ